MSLENELNNPGLFLLAPCHAESKSPRTRMPFRIHRLATAVVAFAASLLFPAAGRAQIYETNNGPKTVGKFNLDGSLVSNPLLTVSGAAPPLGIAVSGNNLYVAQITTTNSIGLYNATTGATTNANFVTGLNSPIGMTVSGSNLYVANFGGNTIGEYNATTGATVSASLLIGGLLNQPFGLATFGGNLYVSNAANDTAGAGTVQVYNATSGAVVNTSFITGLNGAYGLTILGSNLYVINASTGIIGEYNATTGTAINASLVTGITTSSARGLSSLNNSLYVVDTANNRISEYNATTGALVNLSLVSSTGAYNVAVVPEPSTWGLIAAGAILFAGVRRRLLRC